MSGTADYTNKEEQSAGFLSRLRKPAGLGRGAVFLYRLDVRGVIAGMERDGFARVDRLFPMSLLREIRAHVMRRHESGELRRRGLVRDIAGRYTAVLPFEGPFLSRSFYGNPKLLSILDGLLGPSYCISSLETVIAMPGSSEQHQHVDGPIRFDRKVGGRKRLFRKDLSALPPYAVTLCVPLCDITEENGPTAIWAGSHRAALAPRPPSLAQVVRRFREVRMVGAFGRSFLFDYRVFHGGRPNYTREARGILMFVFTRCWFRDPNLAEVQPGVVIKPRALARVPARFRDLFYLAPAARRALWR